MRTEIDDITVRSRVMRAALRAAEAQTVPGIEPVDRLKVLRECHGEVLAVRGPGSPLSFEDFRRAVAEDLSRLLPDGVASDEFEQLSSIDQGHIDPTAFDIAAEEQMVLKHVLRKARGSGRLASTSELQSEIEQEMVYTYLRKPGEQRAYEAGRSALIKHPYYPAEDLCDLAIPVSVGSTTNRYRSARCFAAGGSHVRSAAGRCASRQAQTATSAGRSAGINRTPTWAPST